MERNDVGAPLEAGSRGRASVTRAQGAVFEGLPFSAVLSMATGGCSFTAISGPWCPPPHIWGFLQDVFFLFISICVYFIYLDHLIISNLS